MYKIIMMSGENYLVNKSEYLSIMKAEKGVFIPRIGVFINKSSVSTAYPNELEVYERKELTTGYLHDGTRVKRHFGQWVDADNMAVDDKGNYSPVRISPEYYPEVAKHCVMTEEEYLKVKHLPKEDRLKLMVGVEPKRTSNGLTHIFEK